MHHNAYMIVGDERDTYKNYADLSEFSEGQSSSSGAPSVESFQNYTNRIVDINTYLANRNLVRDGATHEALKRDLIENI